MVDTRSLEDYIENAEVTTDSWNMLKLWNALASALECIKQLDYELTELRLSYYELLEIERSRK